MINRDFKEFQKVNSNNKTDKNNSNDNSKMM
jgi:hypothetical protein